MMTSLSCLRPLAPSGYDDIIVLSPPTGHLSSVTLYNLPPLVCCRHGWCGVVLSVAVSGVRHSGQSSQDITERVEVHSDSTADRGEGESGETLCSVY